MARTNTALSSADSKKIGKFVADSVPEKQQAAAQRFLIKARKVQLGTRTCSMTAGEDGFKDAERTALLLAILPKCTEEWIQKNRTKLGYTRPKAKAAPKSAPKQTTKAA